MKREDIEIATWIIESAGDSRCPVNSSSGYPIQFALDNFNHKERTESGISVSDDTAMVVWQNRKRTDEEWREIDVFTKRKVIKAIQRKRALDATLPCQELVESGLRKKNADIPSYFTVSSDSGLNLNISQLVQEDFFAWWFSRHLGRVYPQELQKCSTPTFIDAYSKLDEDVGRSHFITEKSFVPILPFSSTNIDTVYTGLLNCLDVLAQREESTGAVWVDEAIYALAIQIQLLRPDEFGSLFLAMGPFHWCNILCAAIGKFLDLSGIADALVAARLFGRNFVENAVLKAGDYVKSREAYSTLAEAILYSSRSS